MAKDSLKRIYLKAIDEVVKGGMTKEDLWDIFEEHLDSKTSQNDILLTNLRQNEEAYNNLLGLTADAYKKHQDFLKDQQLEGIEGE